MSITNVSASVIPRVGVGVFILNEKNEFVFGQRKGSHGQGTWALPGGHLELNEDFEECSRREIMEETGMELTDIQYLTATNSTFIDGSKHYITIFMVAKPKLPASQPQLLEPNKCEGWSWISWDTMLEWYQDNKAEDKSGAAERDVKNNLFQPMIDLVGQRPGLRPLHTNA